MAGATIEDIMMMRAKWAAAERESPPNKDRYASALFHGMMDLPAPDPDAGRLPQPPGGSGFNPPDPRMSQEQYDALRASRGPRWDVPRFTPQSPAENVLYKTGGALAPIAATLPLVPMLAPGTGLMGLLTAGGAALGGTLAGEIRAEGGGDLASQMATDMGVDTALTALAGIPAVVGTTGRRAVRAAGKATRVVGKYTDNVADLRVMPSHADAYDVARHEPHLIRKGKGDYTGGPRGVKTPRGVAKMRSNYDELVELGQHEGAAWYKTLRKRISTVARGHETQYSQQFGMASPQALPEVDHGFVLTGHNNIQAGTPKSIVHTGQIAQDFKRLAETGEANLNLKTGTFAQAIDPNQPPTIGGTHDIWDARAWGYTNPKGKPWKAGLSENQHRFLDYEVVLATERANARKMGGRSDWTADEIQAAAWVAKGGQDRAARFGGDIDKAMASMASTDFFEKHAMNATREAVPSAAGTHMPELATASDRIKREYQNDPRTKAWASRDGRTHTYEAQGRYQLPEEPYVGVFTGSTGKTEFNPGVNARPQVAFERDATGSARVAKVDREAADAAEATHGFFDAQAGSAWNKPIPVGKQGVRAGEANSLLIDTGKLNKRQTKQLHEMAVAAGYNTDSQFPIKNSGSLVLMDFNSDPKQMLKNARAFKKRLENAGYPDMDVVRARTDSNYINFEKGRKYPGTRYATRRWIENTTGKRGRDISASQDVRDAVGGLADRDDALAAKHGWSVDKPTQLVRRIFAKGGRPAVYKALRAGAILPAAAFILLQQLDKQERYRGG